MNRTEFIDVLEKSLLRLPKSSRDDILSDFDAHFTQGTAEGKTEEQVAAELGDPAELAKTYLENLPEGSKGAPATYGKPDAADEGASGAPDYLTSSDVQPDTRAASSTGGDKTGAIIGVIFLSMLAIGVMCGLIQIWSALPAIAVGAVVGAFALLATGIIFASKSVLVCVGGVLLCLALLALSALAIIGAIAAAKGLVKLAKIYIDFCKKLINGGND